MHSLWVSKDISLRKPADMSLEKDLSAFRNFVIKKSMEMLNDPYFSWDRHGFVLLRNLVVSRLTLFNARRGGVNQLECY